MKGRGYVIQHHELINKVGIELLGQLKKGGGNLGSRISKVDLQVKKLLNGVELSRDQKCALGLPSPWNASLFILQPVPLFIGLLLHGFL